MSEIFKPLVGGLAGFALGGPTGAAFGAGLLGGPSIARALSGKQKNGLLTPPTLNNEQSANAALEYQRAQRLKKGRRSTLLTTDEPQNMNSGLLPVTTTLGGSL